MRAVGVVVALGAALTLQQTLAGLTIGGAGIVNLVLVAVVFLALSFGPITGIVAGTVGGLAQDMVAGGILGVGGFSKTLVGFAIGGLGAQFIVAQWVPRLILFVAASFVHESCFEALTAIVEQRRFTVIWSAVLLQAAVNGAVGLLVFMVVEQGPGLVQRRRADAAFSRRRY